MKNKKENGTQKKPKETGTWYKSLIEGKVKAEYYRHFIKKLNDIITEHFGKDEALRVLKAIETQKIQVPGIESFLFDFNDISDPSLELYNRCRTVDEFITESIIFFKKRAERGETNICIKDFFLVLADLLKTNELYPPLTIKEILRNFIFSLITVADKSPYNFIIIEPKWAKEICLRLGLDAQQYKIIFSSIVEIFKELMFQIKDIRAFLPTTKIIYPVYYDARDNQLTYLVSRFRMTDRASIVINTLQHISDLSKDTPKLRSALEYLKEKANVPFLNINAVVLELQRLQESSYLKRYPDKRSLTSSLVSCNIPKSYYNELSLEPVFIDKESFENGFIPYFCDVQINCAKVKRENIESFIDVAKTINLTKGYYAKTKRDINQLVFKITLQNVKDVTKEFLNLVSNKIRRIESLTNKKFIVEIFYDKDTVNKRIPEDIITHFRVISDIHADYNESHNYLFNFDNDFVINCGDTGGNSTVAGNWITNFMRKGVTVIGNHFGYSSSFPERDGIQNVERYENTKHISNTKAWQVQQLFNLLSDKNITLLSNTCIEYNGIIIIGTCLYTDFDLYGKDHREECMAYAKKYMNDFRLPVVLDNQSYTQGKDGTWIPHTKKKSISCIRTFSPSDHAAYFQYSFGFIKQKVEEYKNKPIIIVTHHAPSPYSISEEYAGSMLNAAFASNLNEFIIEHPQIRLWAHGHTHSPCDYILGETRVVCCPFGYNNENNFNLPYEYGLRIPIADIKSKKSWRKILAKNIVLGRINVYDE